MTPFSELDRLFAQELRAIPKPDPLADDVDCETCEGLGHFDERLGGYSFSNPKAPCPDCDGRGWHHVTNNDPVDADEAYLWAGDGWLDIATDERFYADDFGNGVFVPFYAEPFYFQEH